MKRFMVVLALAWSATCVGLHARLFNVPGDFSAIQDAINAAVDNDTVLVAQGIYYENLFLGGRNIILASHFIFTGDQDDIANTIIDGNSCTSVLVINQGENSDAVIDGFTIQNGHSGYRGGGIFIENASPVICNNIIQYNDSYDDGGGIAIMGTGASPLITHNLIAYNRSSYANGGGISSYHSTVTVENNLIIGNWAFK